MEVQEGKDEAVGEENIGEKGHKKQKKDKDETKNKKVGVQKEEEEEENSHKISPMRPNLSKVTALTG